MAKTSPPYLKLPNELWDVIFSYGFVRSDFLALSYLNKFFNEAVEPSLYSDFTWIPKASAALPTLSKLKDRDIRPYTKTRRSQRPELPKGYFSHQAPYLLLKAILDSPKRAGYVKTARILAPTAEAGVFWDSYHARENGFDDAQFDTCKKTIDLLPPKHRSYWIDGLYKGKLEIIIGILLLRLTGLETIEVRLRDMPTSGSAVLYALRSPLAARPPLYRYPNVKSVSLSVDLKYGKPVRKVQYPDAEDIFHTYHPAPGIFDFTKLENFSLSSCCMGPWNRRLNAATNLKKLTLRHGRVNEHDLAVFLAATPFLEDLECELFYDNTILQYLDCVALKAALMLVKSTLKRLVLDITVHYGGSWSLPWTVSGVMGDLKAFEELRYLDIPAILYSEEIYQASQSASLMSWDETRVDYWGNRLPDGLEWFGIRVGRDSSITYGRLYGVEGCMDAYLRKRGVKRIVHVDYFEDEYDEDDEDDEDDN
ncbi:hypothetical protein VTL71DRAFT_384 [Oculimacula yallundae]|uniref:F-box domain-containing protein n=1 Tax=Oculimacula yallundae TaxID=86028 RepID=A0ABR4D0Z4_9HELO